MRRHGDVDRLTIARIEELEKTGFRQAADESRARGDFRILLNAFQHPQDPNPQAKKDS